MVVRKEEKEKKEIDCYRSKKRKGKWIGLVKAGEL